MPLRRLCGRSRTRRKQQRDRNRGRLYTLPIPQVGITAAVNVMVPCGRRKPKAQLAKLGPAVKRPVSDLVSMRSDEPRPNAPELTCRRTK